MKKAALKAADASLLPVILLAAQRYPDRDFRLQLWQQIQEWIAGSGPEHTNADIVEVLMKCKGTPLEPFWLMDDDLQMAATLAQVAFSSTYRQSRFRVVSRDTIGHSGGCVITNDLNCLYVERFACGHISKIPEPTWAFAPSEEPVSAYSSVLPKSTCCFGDKGLSFRVADCNFSKLGWRPQDSRKISWPEFYGPNLEDDLNTNSNIGGRAFGTFNLRIRVDKETLAFSTEGPETLMRLIAYFIDGAAICFDPGPKYPSRIRLIYRPGTLGGTTSVKGCMMLPESSFEAWLDFPVKTAPEVDVAKIALIIRHFALPDIPKAILSGVLL